MKIVYCFLSVWCMVTLCKGQEVFDEFISFFPKKNKTFVNSDSMYDWELIGENRLPQKYILKYIFEGDTSKIYFDNYLFNQETEVLKIRKDKRKVFPIGRVEYTSYSYFFYQISDNEDYTYLCLYDKDFQKKEVLAFDYTQRFGRDFICTFILNDSTLAKFSQQYNSDDKPIFKGELIKLDTAKLQFAIEKEFIQQKSVWNTKDSLIQYLPLLDVDTTNLDL